MIWIIFINSLLVIAELTLLFDETRLELAIGDMSCSTLVSFCHKIICRFWCLCVLLGWNFLIFFSGLLIYFLVFLKQNEKKVNISILSSRIITNRATCHVHIISRSLTLNISNSLHQNDRLVASVLSHCSICGLHRGNLLAA